jgi:hypothetical protein
MIKEIYVRTMGRPIEVVTKGLADIAAEFGERVVIRGVGTTGSGRELIGELVGADTVNDEITAHKTGATFVARTMLVGRLPDTIDAADLLRESLKEKVAFLVGSPFFVDGSVSGYADLVRDIAADLGGRRDYRIVVLEGGRDGIEQMSRELSRRANLKAVHVLSHATPSALRLGSSWLDLDSAGEVRAAFVKSPSHKGVRVADLPRAGDLGDPGLGRRVPAPAAAQPIS